MEKSIKQRLATLGLALGIASPIKPDTDIMMEKPTIITVYIYKNANSSLSQAKANNENPDQSMIDEIKNLLKLTKEEEGKLTQLIKQQKFDEAREYLKKLLKKHNIEIRFEFINEPFLTLNNSGQLAGPLPGPDNGTTHTIQPQFSRPIRIWEDDLKSSGKKNNPSPDREIREITIKVGSWLEALETARRKKEEEETKNKPRYID